MINTVSLKKQKIGNEFKVFKKIKSRYYVKEWQMYFDTKEEMDEFSAIMAQAEDDIKYGRVTTMEEMVSYFRQELRWNI